MRVLRGLLAFALVGAILAGCGSSAPADNSTATVDKKSDTIKDK